jgi:predicted O-linked N-acetylglucosamine transferase (SPINDLY family)
MSDQLKAGRVRNDDTTESIAKGAALHQAGELEEAAKIYKEILARSPHDFHATHLLGVVALQQGKFGVAQQLINFALTIRPHDTAAISNLGVSYLRDGQMESALQWFEIAIKLQPESSAALSNAAEVMHHMGRYRDAIPLLKKAHAIDASSYQVCNLLGACLMQIGDEHDAVGIFEAAVQLHADDAEPWANLAIALQAVGQNKRARECANRAAALQPTSPAALSALAKAQFEQGRIQEATENYRRGLSLGTPSVDLILAYANALLASGLNETALEQLHTALAIDESNLTVRWLIAMGSLKTVYDTESEVLASRQAFSKSLEDIGLWYESRPETRTPYETVGTMQPFYLAYQHYNNRDLLKRYGGLCVEFMASLPRHISAAGGGSESLGDPPIGRKLRLGVVSAHIREHSIWTAISKGWLKNLDRDKFEIYVFHLSSIVDGETEATMASVDHFDNQIRDVADWVETISSSKLDVILYPEIGTDSLTLKLASLRLAPVQSVTWGHPETSGLPTIDLYFSARAFEPDDASDDNYSEKLVMLPNLSVYAEPLALPHTDPDLESLRLPTDQPLLLCPGQPFKYAPQYDHVWVQIAKGLQRRRLFRSRSAGRLVFFRSHNDTWDRMLERRLRAAFVSGGIDFDAHVSIIPFLGHPQFFGLMRCSALMLDTLGFSGFNTALQGIECGLPVLAFEGNFLRARLASAIMRELELPELVATSTEDFVKKAVVLTKDPEKLKGLAATMVARRESLYRNTAPVRTLERYLIEAVAH